MDKQIFISASYYKQKYYANPKYEEMPASIRNQMRSLCIMLAEQVHGIITLGFYPSGDVFMEVEAEEGDHEYDEIDAKLRINQAKKENDETFKKMKVWYLMYQTEYGDLFREIIMLFHKEQKPTTEIIDILSDKYGAEMKSTITEMVEAMV